MSAAVLLRRVASYRRAARRAATAGAPQRDRMLALIRLAEEARQEEDATARHWCERVVFEEASPLLHPHSPADGPGDLWERAQRRLRAAGYVTCPECRATLADDLLLERLQRKRETAIRRAEARERAVEATEAAARGLEVST